MYKHTVEDFEKYWSNEQGAKIHYFEDNFSAPLTIGVNLNYGFYFNYSDRITEEISLFDINETTDEL